MPPFRFAVTVRSSQCGARAGFFKVRHGLVETPVFMPVGSQATVKAMTPDDLKKIGMQIILTNAYHLYLRPGIDIVSRHGGIHKFMSWNRPVLTDSGGYQLFSLARLTRVDNCGVLFRSHIDGSEHFLTPEHSVHIQELLGADIIMAFDECSSYGNEKSAIKMAMERTHLWAKRCIEAVKSDSVLFGIIQGGTYKDLRKESALYISSLPFCGFAIGGLSIGEPKTKTWETAEFTAQLIAVDKPRYLMGVGSPEDLVTAVSLGIDMFDSALPTRVGRNGGLLTSKGRLNIRNSKYKKIDSSFDISCDCYTCKKYSASYLHHLFRCEELLAYRLATYHNLHFITNLMREMRGAIIADRFSDFKKQFLSEYVVTEETTRLEQKDKWLKRQA